MSHVPDNFFGSDAHQFSDALTAYRAILDNAPLGISFTTRERLFLHCNQQFGRMFGWTPEELRDQSTRLLFASDEAFTATCEIAEKLLGHGQRLDTEIELMRRDGSLFWVRLLANVADASDPGKGAIFMVEDISERKSEEKINRRRLLEYHSILDNASLGITFVRKRQFKHTNARFGEMFGWPSADLVDKSLSVVSVSEQEFIEIGNDVHAHLAVGRKYESERLMKRRDGSLFWCRLLAKLVDPDDPKKGSIFITEDISERKLAQEELESRVKRRTAELAATNVRLEHEIAERHLIELQVRHLANHDVLTDLPNRRLLEDRLDQALKAARRSGHPVAAMFIDLDHFKPVNDTLGHRIGDLLLQAVARRLSSQLRESDTVARVGGDEFVLLLPELHSRDDTIRIAERVMASLVQPYLIEGHELRISTSIGIGLYPEDGHNADTLLGCADAAMYRAKEGGRNHYRFYSPQPPHPGRLPAAVQPE